MNQNTRETYRAQLERVRADGLPWPPTATELAIYLSELAEHYAGSTVRVRLAAIGAGLAGEFPEWPEGERVDRSELVREMVKQILEDSAHARRDPPLRLALLRRALRASRPVERAALAVTWWGALRPSETVAIRWGDLREHPRGLELTIRASKRSASESTVALLHASDPEVCPVALLGAVRRPCDGDDARPFPYGRRWPARILQRALRRSGVNRWADYTARSLRAGAATSAAEAGADIGAIARHLRHRSLDTTRIYSERGSAWAAHPLASLADAD